MIPVVVGSSPIGHPTFPRRPAPPPRKWQRPDLALTYLPHLDYNLQRLGPDDSRLAEDLRAIDAIVGDLLDFYAKRSVRVAILSEYGITAVRRSIALNRVFRAKGWLTVKDELVAHHEFTKRKQIVETGSRHLKTPREGLPLC